MWKKIFYLLFITIVVYPYTFYEFKIPIIAFALVISVVKIIISGKFDMSKSTFFLFINYILIGLFFIIYGFITRNSHGDSYPFTLALYVIFPIIYLFLFSGINKEPRILKIIDKLFLFCSVFISVVMYLAVLNKRGNLPKDFEFLVSAVNNVDIRTVKDVVKINYNAISSLVFLFPYLFAVFALNKKPKKKAVTFIYLLSLALSIYAVFISGRRALIVILLFSVIITLFYKFGLHKKIKIKVKTVKFILICMLVSLPFLNYNKLYKSFSSTISFALNINYHKDSSSSDDERIKQATSFAKNIVKKPILGYGHGATMKESVRSKAKPWRYELSYLDLAFHTGILGLILYSLGPFWILWSLKKIIKNGSSKYKAKAFAIFMGFSSILITYITNPYLNAFDIQWVIYFPLLFINIANRNNIYD